MSTLVPKVRPASKKNTTQSIPISEYIHHLHAHGVGSAEAELFKKRYWNDLEFRRQAIGAERLFEYKDLILEQLDSSD